MKKAEKTTKENLEERFDSGQSVLDYFDVDATTVRVNVDFPVWMLNALDKESTRRGVARQALVKMWIADRIDSLINVRKPAKPARRRHAV